MFLFLSFQGTIDGKKVRKSVKSRDFGLDTLFVKRSTMENMATIVQEPKTGDHELYFRCAYINFILAEYLSRTLILVS